VSKPELRGLANDLRPTIPALAKLNENSVPFLEKARALSACTTNFLVPFANKPIPDPEFNIPDSTFLHDSNHGFVGLAAESRYSDANSPLFHVQQGGGPFSVVQTDDLGRKTVSFGGLLLKPEGSRPAKPDSRPVFRPNIPCETQQLPDLNAPAGPAEKLAQPNPVASAANSQREAAAKLDLQSFMRNLTLVAQGKPADDALAKYNSQLARLGVKEANKLLKIPMQKLAQSRDNPARAAFPNAKKAGKGK
jgi:hypothetical protein